MLTKTWFDHPLPDFLVQFARNCFRRHWVTGQLSPNWTIFAVASFLVSVLVFFQAPLVRYTPWLSLAITSLWLGFSWKLLSPPISTNTDPTAASPLTTDATLPTLSLPIWGDLLLGFTGCWLTGSIYWGWFRWEPLLHLPIEALAMPLALGCLWCNRGKIGSWFYLGSLFGTAITDSYFYLMNLIPHWRQLMQVDPSFARPILGEAIAIVRTPVGLIWAMVLIGILLVVGIVPLNSRQLHRWAFSGAVLSTILVDSLFVLAAFGA